MTLTAIATGTCCTTAWFRGLHLCIGRTAAAVVLAAGRLMLENDEGAGAGRQLLQRRCRGCKYYKWCRPAAAAAAAAAAGGSAAAASAAASRGTDISLFDVVIPCNLRG